MRTRSRESSTKIAPSAKSVNHWAILRNSSVIQVKPVRRSMGEYRRDNWSSFRTRNSHQSDYSHSMRDDDDDWRHSDSIEVRRCTTDSSLHKAFERIASRSAEFNFCDRKKKKRREELASLGQTTIVERGNQSNAKKKNDRRENRQTITTVRRKVNNKPRLSRLIINEFPMAIGFFLSTVCVETVSHCRRKGKLADFSRWSSQRLEHSVDAHGHRIASLE